MKSLSSFYVPNMGHGLEYSNLEDYVHGGT